MTVTGLPYLRPPELLRRSPWEDAHETRVANWIRPWDGQEPFDVGLLMVPIARGAIKHVAAHLGPNALRMVWPFFTTYSIDFDVDLADLRVRDLGDVEISLLDVPEADVARQAHDPGPQRAHGTTTRGSSDRLGAGTQRMARSRRCARTSPAIRPIDGAPMRRIIESSRTR